LLARTADGLLRIMTSEGNHLEYPKYVTYADKAAAFVN
jgi:hypothetical protein